MKKNSWLFLFLFISILILGGCQSKFGGYDVFLISEDTTQAISIQYNAAKAVTTESITSPFYKLVSFTSKGDLPKIAIKVCRQNNSGKIRGYFSYPETVVANNQNVQPSEVFIDALNGGSKIMSADSMFRFLKASGNEGYFEMSPSELCKEFASK
jgi:hypothetical protein